MFLKAHDHTSHRVGEKNGLRNFFFHVFFTGVTVVLGIQWGAPLFGANDEFAFTSFLDGSFTGKTESDLVFIPDHTGIFLSWLYVLFPGFSWYELFLSLSGQSIFLSVAWLLRRRGFGIQAGLAAFEGTMLLWLVQNPNYTTVSILAVGIGSAVLALGVTNRPGASWIYLGVFLILSGLSWRWNAVYVVPFLFLSTWLGALVIKTPRSLKLSGAFAQLGLGLLFLVPLASTFEALNSSCIGRSAAACDSWAEYDEYNERRGSIHGSPRATFLKDFPHEQDVFEPAETALFLGWSYFSEKRFGFDEIERLNEQLPSQAEIALTYGSPISFMANSIETAIANNKRFLAESFAIWWAVVLFWVLLGLKDQWPHRLALGAAMGGLGSVLAGLGSAMVRLPSYALTPLLFVTLLVPFLIFSKDSTSFSMNTPVPYSVGGRVRILIAVMFIALGATTELLLFLDSRVVSLGTVVALLLFGITLLGRRTSTSVGAEKPLNQTLISAGIVVFFSFSPAGFFEEASKGFAARENYIALQDELVASDFDGPIFASGIWGSAFSGPAFFDVRYPENLNFSGWTVFSPYWNSRLDAMNIANPINEEDLVSDEVALLGSRDWVEWFASNLYEMTGLGVEAEEIYVFSSVDASLWILVPSDKLPQTLDAN